MMFSILVLSTKRRCSRFLKKVFVFQKICFKVKVWKSFKISTGCHIKTCRSLKRRAILKILSTVFRRIYTLSVGFKIKPLRKSVFQCYDKNQPKFCRKTCWKEQTIHFYCLFDESHFSNIICTYIKHFSNSLIRGNRM